jgi:DNA-binding MarR family transcriptional regulator
MKASATTGTHRAPRRERLAGRTGVKLRDGLVERRADPDDRRATRVFLTTRSKAFAKVAARVLGELDSLVMKRLGARHASDLTEALSELMDLDR